MAGHNPDDEDTREHAAAPRYPDAPPPGAPAPDVRSDAAPEAGREPEQESGQSWSASDEAAATAAQPTSQWPQPVTPTSNWPAGTPDPGRQPWPDQPGAQRQAADQWQRPPEQWGQPPAGQQWQAPAPEWQRPTTSQQQWQQPPPTWQQQPGQAWQQPPQHWQQQQQWQQRAAPWESAPAWTPEQRYAADYPTSPMVAIGGIVLIVFGIFATLIGGLGVAIGGMFESILREVQDMNPPELQGINLSGLGDVLLVIFGFVLVMGILHIVSAIGIFAHRQWGRIIGIVLAVMGTLFGVLGLVGATNVPGGLDGSEWAVPIILVVGYGFTLFALIAGSNHFRRRYSR